MGLGLAVMLACTDEASEDPGVPTDSAVVGTSVDTATETAPLEPPCPTRPCVAELARSVLLGRDEWPGGLGYSLASAGDRVVAGAPYYQYEPAAERAVLVGLPDLELLGAWVGIDEFDYTGLAVAAADTDGDGLPEVAVSRHNAHDSQDGGRVHLLPGSVEGEVDASEVALLTLVGDLDVALGYALRFSDDGAELVVSGGRQDATGGRILSFSTAARGVVHEREALRTLRSTDGLDFFETWDGDGDGAQDLVVRGRDGVSLFWGPWTDLTSDDRALAYTDSSALENGTGQVLADVGDVTGDGRADLAFAAPTHGADADRAGRAYLLADAGAGGSADDIDTQLRGTEVGDGMGFALAGADVDGDGQRDLVASASGVYPGTQPGVVLVYRGPIGPGIRTAADADAAVYAERGVDLFARAIAVVDADGDTHDDLVLGAPSWPAGRGDGAVYLVEGAAILP
ncbi:MAG: hypothetical protein R3F59_36700 [Myxococcota bacterium]